MKDYFDLLALARENAMDRADLTRAIAGTFERRGMKMPDAMPLGLTDEFAQDPQKQQQWKAFLSRNRLKAPALETVIRELRDFLQQPLDEVRGSG